VRATSGRAGREMIAAIFFAEDEGELGMMKDGKKDCTESESKTLTQEAANH